MTEEEKHLDYLKIGHYVLGGIGVLFACFPLLHVAMGLAFISGSFDATGSNGASPPNEFGWIFVIMGGLFFLMGQACAIGTILSGRFIGKRKNYLFSFILACILCVAFPFGTVLGVFTIVILSKEPVKNLYGKN